MKSLGGYSIVMEAINTLQDKALVKAISMSSHGKRPMELLNVALGTQSISQYHWAFKSASFATTQAMINDLLTIRADRDNYYYGHVASSRDLSVMSRL